MRLQKGVGFGIVPASCGAVEHEREEHQKSAHSHPQNQPEPGAAWQKGKVFICISHDQSCTTSERTLDHHLVEGGISNIMVLSGGLNKSHNRNSVGGLFCEWLWFEMISSCIFSCAFYFSSWLPCRQRSIIWSISVTWGCMEDGCLNLH